MPVVSRSDRLLGYTAPEHPELLGLGARLYPT
jgi:hypothetical protein